MPDWVTHPPGPSSGGCALNPIPKCVGSPLSGSDGGAGGAVAGGRRRCGRRPAGRDHDGEGDDAHDGARAPPHPLCCGHPACCRHSGTGPVSGRPPASAIWGHDVAVRRRCRGRPGRQGGSWDNAERWCSLRSSASPWRRSGVAPRRTPRAAGVAGRSRRRDAVRPARRREVPRTVPERLLHRRRSSHRHRPAGELLDRRHAGERRGVPIDPDASGTATTASARAPPSSPSSRASISTAPVRRRHRHRALARARTHRSSCSTPTRAGASRTGPSSTPMHPTPTRAAADRPPGGQLPRGPPTSSSRCATSRTPPASRSSPATPSPRTATAPGAPTIVPDRHEGSCFADARGAGVERDDLYLAWDFTVASERNLSERLLHIRDDVFASLGGAAPAFTVTNVEPTTSTTAIARRVTGTFTVPNYLTGDGGPGTRFNYGGRRPACPRATATSPRRSAATSRAPRLDRGDPSRPARRRLRPRPARQRPRGRTPATSRHGERARLRLLRDQVGRHVGGGHRRTSVDVLGDLSQVPDLADRLQQGILNTLFLGRLMMATGRLRVRPGVPGRRRHAGARPREARPTTATARAASSAARDRGRAPTGRARCSACRG